MQITQSLFTWRNQLCSISDAVFFTHVYFWIILFSPGMIVAKYELWEVVLCYTLWFARKM